MCVYMALCVHVCMCVQVYGYMYVCMYVCIYIYICIYACVCVCAYMCVCVYMCLCIYMYIFVLYTFYSLVYSISSCTKVLTILLSHIRHAFRGSQFIPICPCMTLHPWSFSLTVYHFYCVIYFDIMCY